MLETWPEGSTVLVQARVCETSGASEKDAKPSDIRECSQGHENDCVGGKGTRKKATENKAHAKTKNKSKPASDQENAHRDEKQRLFESFRVKEQCVHGVGE